MNVKPRRLYQCILFETIQECHVTCHKNWILGTTKASPRSTISKWLFDTNFVQVKSSTWY